MTQAEAAQLTRLLVAGDTTDAIAAAMPKAAMIEHYTGAAVSVVLTFYDPIADEPEQWFDRADTLRIVERIKDHERQQLEAVVAPWREHIADLEMEVFFERDTAEAIRTAAVASSASLILKPLARTSRIADFLHAPVDWKLMRDAPCPVLFTRPQAWHKPIRVLAAVDASDERHIDLNREILHGAALLGAVLDGELHVVSVYPSLGQHLSQYQVADDFAAIKADMRARRHDVVQRLVTELGIPAVQIHIEEGRPKQVIAGLAKRIDAGLTVLGTAARTGLRKLLIGNTAEQIVGDIDTDLLTVRSRD